MEKKTVINNDNNEQIDISFCLPVYNVSKWLKKCISSILAVNGIRYEIICVDDCSTDDSYDILLDIASEYDCVVVKKNEKNCGVSFTRNAALKQARGRYIWFVDPDDLIIPSTALSMVKIADSTSVDYVFGNYVRIVGEDDICINGNEENNYFVCKNDRRDKNWVKTLPIEKESNRVMRSIWAGIYRKSFLDRYDIRFIDGVNMCEDIAFNYKAEVFFDKMAKYDNVVYKYRINSASACHTFSKEKRVKTYFGAKKMYESYCEYLDNGIYSKTEYGFVPKETLQMRISRLQQNIVTDLASVSDFKFVKQNLRELKKAHIYPYKFKKDILLESGKSIRNILFYLIPCEPFFWLLHIVYRIVYRKK